MTTWKAVTVWTIGIVLSIIVGWEFFKTLFEIRATILRYIEFRSLRTEPADAS